MTIYIYAEIVFLINFAINTVIMLLVKVLCRRHSKWWLLPVGGAASALLYTIALFILPYNFLGMPLSFVVLAPGVWLSFLSKSERGIKRFAINLITSYICSFVLSGIVLVVGDFYATLLNLIIATAIALAIIQVAKKYIATKALDKKTFCQVRVNLEGKEASTIALIDTGMSLKEPLGQKNVIIIEASTLEGILPEEIKEIYINNKQDDLSYIAKSFEEANMQSRIRMVPFRSIGNNNGVLIGFRPDDIWVDKVHRNDIVVAICDFDLSEDGEYKALLGALDT